MVSSEILNRHNQLAEGKTPNNQVWLVCLRAAAEGNGSVAAGLFMKRGKDVGSEAACCHVCTSKPSNPVPYLQILFFPFRPLRVQGGVETGKD